MRYAKNYSKPDIDHSLNLLKSMQLLKLKLENLGFFVIFFR